MFWSKSGLPDFFCSFFKKLADKLRHLAELGDNTSGLLLNSFRFLLGLGEIFGTKFVKLFSSSSKLSLKLEAFSKLSNWSRRIVKKRMPRTCSRSWEIWVRKMQGQNFLSGGRGFIVAVKIFLRIKFTSKIVHGQKKP